MTQNKDNLDSTGVDIRLASAKRMQMFSELYNLLYTGFGKNIASKIAASLVNTVDTARHVLEKQKDA